MAKTIRTLLVGARVRIKKAIYFQMLHIPRGTIGRITKVRSSQTVLVDFGSRWGWVLPCHVTEIRLVR